MRKGYYKENCDECGWVGYLYSLQLFCRYCGHPILRPEGRSIEPLDELPDHFEEMKRMEDKYVGEEIINDDKIEYITDEVEVYRDLNNNPITDEQRKEIDEAFCNFDESIMNGLKDPVIEDLDYITDMED